MAVPLVVDVWPVAPIRTARLVLRAPEARDREAFLDLGSDDEVNRHLGGGRDRAALDAQLPEVPADRPGQFVVEHEGRFVGWVGLGRRDPSRPGADLPDLELSWVTPVVAWGHGYATEAAAAVLAWGDAVLGEPVLVCTQVTNARSLALAGRLGFTEVARHEEHGAEQWIGVRHPGMRRAAPGDAAALARVAEAAYSPYLARMGGQRPAPLDTDYAAALTDTGTEAWLVERDGEVVGFVLLVGEDDGLLLDNVAVLPSHHGTGIGRALLTLADGRAVALGRSRVRLYTHVTMVENQRLYVRLGYVETHRAGEPGLVRVFYTKRVGPVSTSRNPQGKD